MSAITYDEVYVYRTLSESPGLTLPEQIVTIKGSQRLDKELNTWQIYKSISMIGCQGPFVHLAVWIIRRESVCWSERVRLLEKGVVSRQDLIRSNASQCWCFYFGLQSIKYHKMYHCVPSNATAVHYIETPPCWINSNVLRSPRNMLH